MHYLTKATTNFYVQVVHVTSNPTVVNWVLLFLFIHLARVNWIGIRLPRLDSLQIGQCFVQENGTYHTRQVSVWLPKIKSNTCGNNFNVIYPHCKLST